VKRRFETIEALAAAGVPVGISVAPIIPGLNEADIPGLLQEARRRGATSAFRTLLRLPGSTRDVFLHRLEEQMPLRAARIVARIRDVRGGKLNESRLGLRGRGQGRYWDTIDRVWELWTRRLGFRDRWADPAFAAPPPRARLQQELPFA
jgi:DNA repair photolyase